MVWYQRLSDCTGTSIRGPVGVANGGADNMSGTSEVPQSAAPLCATRKSSASDRRRLMVEAFYYIHRSRRIG
jgi:hypothetical protein